MSGGTGSGILKPMTEFEQIIPLASLIAAFATILVTAFLMARQVKAMEHERHALALLDAIDRISSNEVIEAFSHLESINDRYPTDEDIHTRFRGSADERALLAVGQYIETVSTLARRGVLSPSLIVDSVGMLIRRRWKSIEPFMKRVRVVDNNPYMLENFEWLAKYSDWWKDIPRPRNDPNYWPDQFERNKAKP
jgi:hypothetical protein